MTPIYLFTLQHSWLHDKDKSSYPPK